MSMNTSTIEDSLSWLEHETKINASLSMAQETKAKLNVLSLAVSTIAELTSTVKELKNEVETLKSEMRELKSEIAQNKKKNLTDEEKEILKEKAIEIIREGINFTAPFPEKLLEELPDIYVRFNVYAPKDPKEHPKYFEYQNKFIETGVNYIVNKSKTIEQGIRISNKLKELLKIINFNDGLRSINRLCRFTCFKDYKIVYFALYEMYWYKAGIDYCGVDTIIMTSFNEGGIYFKDEGNSYRISEYL